MIHICICLQYLLTKIKFGFKKQSKGKDKKNKFKNRVKNQFHLILCVV